MEILSFVSKDGQQMTWLKQIASSIYVVNFLFEIIYNKTHYKLREIEIIVHIETSFTVLFVGLIWSATVEINAFFAIE